MQVEDLKQFCTDQKDGLFTERGLKAPETVKKALDSFQKNDPRGFKSRANATLDRLKPDCEDIIVAMQDTTACSVQTVVKCCATLDLLSRYKPVFDAPAVQAEIQESEEKLLRALFNLCRELTAELATREYKSRRPDQAKLDSFHQLLTAISRTLTVVVDSGACAERQLANATKVLQKTQQLLSAIDSKSEASAEVFNLVKLMVRASLAQKPTRKWPRSLLAHCVS